MELYKVRELQREFLSSYYKQVSIDYNLTDDILQKHLKFVDKLFVSDIPMFNAVYTFALDDHLLSLKSERKSI